MEAMSRAVPTRPRGWKPSKPASVWSIWSLGMKPSYRGVFTTAGATALTRILCGASSRARFLVSAWIPAFATEYPDDGVAPIAWCAHMLPMLTMEPPLSAVDHALRHRLGDEEDRAGQLQVGVVELTVVLEIRPGDEEARGVDEQRRVSMIGGQLPAHILHLRPIREVSGDPDGVALVAELSDGLVDPVLVAADDDDAAALDDDVRRILLTHTAAAAHCDQLASFEATCHVDFLSETRSGLSRAIDRSPNRPTPEDPAVLPLAVGRARTLTHELRGSVEEPIGS